MTIERERFWLEVCAIGLLAIVCLFVTVARNTDPILNPAMLTEDGSWTSMYFRVGMARTFFEARPDYFVFGNVALLQIAMSLNYIYSGDNIDHLPVFIAIVSFVFYGVVSAFVAVALRPYMRLLPRLACVAAVVLLPMGASMNEILGRVSNTGFAFYLVATLALVWRSSFQFQKFSSPIFFIDIILIICAFTNPLTAVPILLFCSTLMLENKQRKSINNFILIVFSLFSLVATVSGLDTPVNTRDHIPVTIEGIFVTGVSRPLIYPFLFPFYSEINNVISIFSAIIVSVYILWGWLVSKSRVAFGIILSSLAFVTVAISATRPDLYAFLVGYEISYPDRYFYAQNALVMIAFIWSTSSLVAHLKTARLVPYALSGVVAIVWVYGAEIIFDPFVPTMMIRTGPDFASQLDNAEPNPLIPGYMTVNIYPDGWSVFYPKRYGAE